MSSRRPTIVHARGTARIDDTMHRIIEATVEATLAAVDSAADPGCLVVDVDAPSLAGLDEDGERTVDHDVLVALVAVLAVRGVRAFETRDVRAVRRILDMHSAITAGAIEVLQS